MSRLKSISAGFADILGNFIAGLRVAVGGDGRERLADGTANIYFGPTTPKVANANWIKTVPGRGYFGGFRLYSPTQAYFDQTWKPDDIVKVK
jgi:hypothetical protein